MAKEFTYKAFGIILKSEFEIPEFLSSEGAHTLEIRLGKTPQKLEKIIQQGVNYQAAENKFLLEVDNIARFYVHEGKEIIVECNTHTPDKEVRLFLLGSVFGALFLQRELLPIHGSTIKFGDSATIFTGLSGAGKSSIAAYFVSQGYHALADDISVVNDEMEVVPGFPSVKIWKDVLQKLKFSKEFLTEIRPNIEKFQVPINDNYYTKPLPLKNIIVINTKNTPGFQHEKLKGISKFNVIKNNTYRYRFVKGLEKQQEHFKNLNKLLPDINVYKLDRPQHPLSLDQFGDFILKMLKAYD